MGCELLGGGREKAMHRFHIHIDHKAAVMADNVFVAIRCPSAELPPVYFQVVPRVLHVFDSCQRNGIHHDAGLHMALKSRSFRDEGDVEVSGVMVDRSSPRSSAGKVHAAFFKAVHRAFDPRILVLPDDHGRLILPQKDDELAAQATSDKHPLEGDVGEGVERGAFADNDFVNRGIRHRSGIPQL